MHRPGVSGPFGWEEAPRFDHVPRACSELDAYRYVSLPPSAPDRAVFRPAYLASLSRHQAIRCRLAPLVAAWHRAGVDTLVFKGFHLSEFVYPVPGARLHGDVDLLVRADQRALAREIALSLGWVEGMSGGRLRGRSSHDCLTLLDADSPVMLDVHDRILQVRSRRSGVQDVLTRAIRERSEQREWEGTSIATPSPADAFLVLALNRAWADGGRLKLHDPIDAQLLARLTSRDAVLERAEALGCLVSVRTFLRSCDPWSDVEPTASRSSHRALDAIRMLPERGWVDGELALREVTAVPRRVAWAIRSLPSVLLARRLLQSETDLDIILERITPASRPDRRIATDIQFWTVGGVRWAIRFFGGRSSHTCVVRSLAIYRRLRLLGAPAKFVSGVRRAEGGQIAGHAWVELDGAALPELKEWRNRLDYAVNIEYPRAKDA